MKSGFQGLIIAFLGTLLIFSIVKTDIYEKIPNLRLLSNRTVSEIRDDMCSRSSSDLLDFYKKTGPNYEYESLNNNEVVKRIIKDFINDPSSSSNINQDDLKEYFKNSSLYIFILILFIFLVILWIPYILCVCCKCCFCIPDSCLKCPKFYVFICLGICALTLINCFIGYSENGNIVDGIYGLGCTILKVEQHLVEGDEYKSVKPYWMGLQPIMDKLEETSKNISSLQGDAEELQIKFNQEVTPLCDSFHEDLNKEYNLRKETKVRNPEPNGETLITSDYILLYGPPETEKTSLNNIYNEINVFYETSLEGINSIAYIIGNATSQTDQISKELEEINNNLKSKIDDIDNSIASKINENEHYFNEFESFSRKFMNILFSFNLIIAIAVGVALLFLLLCSKGLFLLCMSWIFLYCLMLLTFFLGALFGLLGSFVQDASASIYYIVNNLNELESIDDKTREITGICLTGNGSLASSSIIPDFDLSIIDNVYSLESFIDEKKEIIKGYDPKSIQTNEKIYNKVLYTKSYSLKLSNALENLRKYTDKNFDGSEVTSTSFEDEWEINKTDCEYSYNNRSSFSTVTFLSENGSCLIISEWSEDEIKERYKDSDKSEEILGYYKSINNYLEDNKILISTIKDKNELFRDNFKTIGAKDIELLDETKEIIKPLRESYEEIVGNNSIFEILNCKFLKRDVNKIMEELYKSFGKTFKTTSTLFLLISVYELAMTLFILFIMKGFSNKNSSKNIEKF